MQPFLTRQDALEGMTAQQELMKQLVSALAEVERGKQAGLNNFLNEYGARIAGRPSKEDYARVKAEVYFVLLVYSQQSVCVCTVSSTHRRPHLQGGRHPRGGRGDS